MKGRPWTEEEVTCLKTYYMDHPYKEIAEMLGRTIGAIECKLDELGLSKHQVYRAKDGVKLCRECREILKVELFSVDNRRADKLNCTCKTCVSKVYGEKQLKKRLEKAGVLDELNARKEARTRTATEVMTCPGCGETKLGEEFHFQNKTLKRRGLCSVCRNKRDRETKLKKIAQGK